MENENKKKKCDKRIYTDIIITVIFVVFLIVCYFFWKCNLDLIVTIIAAIVAIVGIGLLYSQNKKNSKNDDDDKKDIKEV